MINIAKLTFLEISKKKVFVVTLILSVLFLLLYTKGLSAAAKEMVGMGNEQIVMQQIIGNQLLAMGLYFASFLLSLLALMAGIASVATEIESGLLHAVVSRPIKRSEIVLGKYLGYGLMLIIYALCLFTVIILLNKYYNPVSLTLLTGFNFVFGAAVFVLQPLVLLSVAMFFSTLFRTLTAGIISAVIYLLGIIGGFVEQIGNVISKASLINIGIVTSLIIPADALFKKMLTIVTGSDANPISTLSFSFGPFGVTSPPSNAMLIYALLYIAACIVLAAVSFWKKDL